MTTMLPVERRPETIEAEEPEPSSPPVPSDEPGLVLGRPIEDRSFEMVEVGACTAAGIAIGTAVAGPVGTAVGGLVGAAAGLVAGEAVERVVGRVGTTTDAGPRTEADHDA